MLIPYPLSQPERRDLPRRTTDRVIDDLHKTFSTSHCHACLERMSDGVLLLDNETRVMYATPQAHQVLSRHNTPITLTPRFTLHHQRHASRFTAFTNEKSHTAGPFSILLEGKNGHDLLLLNCFKLPKPTEPDVQAARYMISLRDPNHYPTQQWQLFSQQFNLTPAEERLCHTLVDGLTLNDYCEKWTVTISTARSQLKSVFDKTSIRRQSDLLRLIFLFTRG